MDRDAEGLDVCVRATDDWPEYLVEDATRRVTSAASRDHLDATRAHLVLMASIDDDEKIVYSARCGVEANGIALTAAAHGPTPPLALERLSERLDERLHVLRKGLFARLLSAASNIA